MNWRDLLSWRASSAQATVPLPSSSIPEHTEATQSDQDSSFPPAEPDLVSAKGAGTTTSSPSPTASIEDPGLSEAPFENVVNLQSRIRPSPHEYRNYSATPVAAEGGDENGFRGLFDDPILKSFFAQNFWGFGNYDGAHYKSLQAMELGKNAITARFQNTLSAMLSRKKAQLTKLQATVIETEGVCPMTTAQLKLACQHVEANIATLEEQLDLAVQGRGWVGDALNRYQIGFTKGLRDTIPFERLL
jgi:hypothetical protein